MRSPKPASRRLIVLAFLAAGCNPFAAQKPAPAPKPAVQQADTPANPPGVDPAKLAPPVPADANADLYADAGDEEILPADKAPADAPMRAPKGATLYRLSNPRIANTGPGPFPYLVVDYERVAGEAGGSPQLVLRHPNGNVETVGITFGPFPPKADRFKVRIGGIGRPGAGGPPTDLEIYLTQTDRRWEDQGFLPKFKVSNSVVLGNPDRPIQLARNWKAGEVAKFRDPPPEGPKPNLNKHVGEDTDFAGDTTSNSVPMRYVDAAGKPVLGVAYSVGEGGDAKAGKEKCLQHLNPLYDARQPVPFFMQKVMAKPGYAVGGLNVKTKRLVSAVQVVFMRLKPDGTLDATDSYTSKWLGVPEVGEKQTKLGGDGRKVIGLHLKHFGVVFAVALVQQ